MFHGSLVALVTPMQVDGVIDVEALRQLIEWHIEQGTDGIVVLGSTGEAPTINHAERKLIIEQAKEQIGDRIPLIAGTGTNATDTTIQLTQEAMQLGVDACLLVTPYYNRPTQEGLYQHFKAVATAVAIPQILYNVPPRTGCDLKPATVQRLINLPNIIGIKETGSLERLSELRAIADHSFDIYSGDDATALDYLSAGACGVISVTANVAPRLMHDLCAKVAQGDAEGAQRCNDLLSAFHQCQGVETNPIPVKWALHLLGRIQPGIRLPLTVLSSEYHPVIKESLIRARLT